MSDAHTGYPLPSLVRNCGLSLSTCAITEIRGLNDAQKASLQALGAIHLTQEHKNGEESAMKKEST